MGMWVKCCVGMVRCRSGSAKTVAMSMLNSHNFSQQRNR